MNDFITEFWTQAIVEDMKWSFFKIKMLIFDANSSHLLCFHWGI
jgi:hypothetical protein